MRAPKPPSSRPPFAHSRTAWRERTDFHHALETASLAKKRGSLAQRSSSMPRAQKNLPAALAGDNKVLLTVKKAKKALSIFKERTEQTKAAVDTAQLRQDRAQARLAAAKDKENEQLNAALAHYRREHVKNG